MSSLFKNMFPVKGGFKLNGGSKPPFSDSGIFSKKIPESENDGLRIFKKGLEPPLVLTPPFKGNLFLSSRF